MALNPPLVGVVVVNYHREDLTLQCLRHLSATRWPAGRLEVVVVDNGSGPGFAEKVAADGLGRVIRPERNLGFAGGCNVGLRALAHCDHVALLNNDAIPEPGWLEPLVEAVEQPMIGAANPKVLLQGSWVRVELSTPGQRAGPNDKRLLGVQVSGAKIDGQEMLSKSHLAEGFWGWEHDAVTVGGRFAWTGDTATLITPASPLDAPVKIELRLSSGLGEVKTTLRCGEAAAIVDVSRQPRWYPMGSTARRETVVNNVGTELRRDGSVADVGFLQRDEGQFAEAAEVFGWSGAAVLLSGAYLANVGLFDDRYFLYYEDSELSWRGRLLGWRYSYVPESVIWHAHSATVGESSKLATHLLARNRLLTVARHAPRSLAVDAVKQSARELVLAMWRDLVRRPLTLHKPVGRHTLALLRVLLGAGRLLPGTLRHRWASSLDDAIRAGVVKQWLRDPP